METETTIQKLKMPKQGLGKQLMLTAFFLITLGAATVFAQVPVAPIATAASNNTFTSFNANWGATDTTTIAYYLDVSTDVSFASFVSGYNNLNVGNVTTYNITGLIPNICYSYRVRASNNSGTSLNSNTISSCGGTSSFIYSSATYCQSGVNPTPTITGLPGGTFTASPAGLVINPSTGLIDLATSALGAYTVTYDSASVTTITITSSTNSPNFSYSGSPFCQNGSNPLPSFGSGASAGVFSAVPAGLVFANVNTGEIDLTASMPGAYTVTNTIPASGSCTAASATAVVTINPAPVAGFTYNNNCNGDTVGFYNGSSVSSGSIVSWDWTFGDGSPSNTLMNPVHLYSNAGNYNVTLVATTNNGCSGTIDIQLPVNSTPIVIALPSLSQSICNGGTTAISLLSPDSLTTYAWTVTQTNVSGATAGSGSYISQTLSLTGSNIGTVIYTITPSNGCGAGTPVAFPVTIDTVCSTLTGVVYNDANNNCAQDNLEAGIAYVSVDVIQGGNVVATAWTDSLGNYTFFALPQGSYTIQVDNMNTGYTISCSNSLPHVINVTTGTTTANFGASCNGSFDVAVTGISLMSGFYPGTDDAILPHVGILNAACNLTIPGQVKMILTPCIQYTTGGNFSFGNPPTAVIHASTGDTLVWNVSDINNIGTFSYWDYAVNITTCTSAQVGDTACITMMVLPTNGDADLSNNTFTRCFAIGVAYDPNSKEVEPKGLGAQGAIPASTPNLTYTINFQNTGTAMARNIYVLDSIDTDLNINSIEILSASHGMQVYMLPNRTIKFMFANIMLPDSTHDLAHSHGYVTFRIKPNTGLMPGTQIKNRGYIYFDYNTLVLTNVTLNTIALPTGINEINKSGLLKVYPNPAKDKLVVSVSNTGNSIITISDVLGKAVKQIKTSELQTEINVSDLQDGIYFIQLTQDNTSYVEKVIINK